MKVLQSFSEVPPRVLPVAGAGVTGRVLIGKADGAVNFCMRMIEVAPGAVIPAHHHPWEHEQFVFSGTGRILKDGQPVDFGPGAVLYIAPDEEHRIENTGSEPLRIVCLVPPFAPEL